MAGVSNKNFVGIADKVAESIEDMDLTTILETMNAHTPDDWEDSEEIRHKLKWLMEQVNVMAPEDKAAFAKQVKDGIVSQMKDPKNPMRFDGLDEFNETSVSQLIFLGIGVAVMLFFFGMYRDSV